MMCKRFGIALLVVMIGALCLDVGGRSAPGEFGFVSTAEAVVGRPHAGECRGRRTEDREAVCRRRP